MSSNSFIHLCIFRSYNASKYSSYYNNASGDKEKQSALESNSSGFHSTGHPRLHTDNTPGRSDYNNNQNTENSRNQTVSHHKRHGSDSVSRDLDSSEILSSERKSSPSEKKNSKGRKEHKSRSESKGKCLGDVTEPLNAQRLRPIRQKTRNAVVSILDDCEVCLEFISQVNNQM